MGKKDKTSPKAYRPVEQHAEALAKPLERLVANRISYEVETRGLLEEDQFGGRPGRSTQQAADAFIHRTRTQMDEGKIVSTLFFDLKGAFNGISHRIVARELAACGFARTTIAWVLSFLDGHRVTVVIDRKRTATFRLIYGGGQSRLQIRDDHVYRYIGYNQFSLTQGSFSLYNAISSNFFNPFHPL
jgi:hypothetical protein